MKNKGVLALVCFVLSGMIMLSLPAVSHAQWPQTPISLIVCYSPGGATDFQARIVTMVAGNEEYFGQPMVVINKPGAGGQVGWNWMIEKGTKDGYTMTAYNMPHFIAQSIVYDTKFNINTFEPLANWGADPAVLIVPKDSPFNTTKDLVEFAKANPGKVTITGAGLYVGHHIATLQLEKAAGIKMTYIPEQGGVDALQSVMAGKVKAGFNNLSDAYRNQDRLKVLAIADLERNDFLPNVPTLKESGYDVDDTSVNFRGLAFPKGVPQEIIDKSADISLRMFDNAQVKSKMKSSGSPLKVMSREKVQEMFVAKEKELRSLLGK